MKPWMISLAIMLAWSNPAHAEFILSNAIVEFTSGGDMQQDVEAISRSGEQDFIVTEAYEVRHPGANNEERKLIDDPAEVGLLVTPERTILPPGGRQVIRCVLMRPLDDAEHIYRVTIKPVINDLESRAKMGLKLLVGYEVLVIVRPATIHPDYTVTRTGNILRIINHGNSNVLLETGRQCPSAKSAPEECQSTPAMRVYAGMSGEIQLPFDAPVSARLWNGVTILARDLP